MKLTLTAKKEETKDTTSFIFMPDVKLTWEAGQFLHYTLPHPDADDRKTERYFTISSAPHEGHVMITTRFAGTDKSSTFKKALFKMNVSDSIEADGLEGDFTFVDPEKNHVFISGGIGITPYHAILMDLDHRGLPINVTLLYANKEKDNVVFMNELEALTVKHPNFKVHYFFDPVRGREGSQRASASNGIDPERIDEAAIKRIVPDLTKPLFYVSGPEIMVEAFEKSLPQMGIPEENTKRDYFPGYNWP